MPRWCRRLRRTGHKDYSATPLWKKLGHPRRARGSYLVGAAGRVRGRARSPCPRRDGPAPRGARPRRGVLFVTRRADLDRHFPKLAAAMRPDGRLWVAWPKKAAKVPTDLDFDAVQGTGLGRRPGRQQDRVDRRRTSRDCSSSCASRTGPRNVRGNAPNPRAPGYHLAVSTLLARLNRPIVAILAVAALAGGIRFFHLSHPTGFVFDEIYYPKAALHPAGWSDKTCHVTSSDEKYWRTNKWDVGSWVHPPLGKWTDRDGHQGVRDERVRLAVHVRARRDAGRRHRGGDGAAAVRQRRCGRSWRACSWRSRTSTS